MPQTVSDLGKLVKAKYPGPYDMLSDDDVGRKVKAKFPGAYDQFADTPTTFMTAGAPGEAARTPSVAEEMVSARRPEMVSTGILPPIEKSYLQGIGSDIANMGKGFMRNVPQFLEGATGLADRLTRPILNPIRRAFDPTNALGGNVQSLEANRPMVNDPEAASMIDLTANTLAGMGGMQPGARAAAGEVGPSAGRFRPFQQRPSPQQILQDNLVTSYGGGNVKAAIAGVEEAKALALERARQMNVAELERIAGATGAKDDATQIQIVAAKQVKAERAAALIAAKTDATAQSRTEIGEMRKQLNQLQQDIPAAKLSAEQQVGERASAQVGQLEGKLSPQQSRLDVDARLAELRKLENEAYSQRAGKSYDEWRAYLDRQPANLEQWPQFKASVASLNEGLVPERAVPVMRAIVASPDDMPIADAEKYLGALKRVGRIDLADITRGTGASKSATGMLQDYIDKAVVALPDGGEQALLALQKGRNIVSLQSSVMRSKLAKSVKNTIEGGRDLLPILKNEERMQAYFGQYKEEGKVLLRRTIWDEIKTKQGVVDAAGDVDKQKLANVLAKIPDTVKRDLYGKDTVDILEAIARPDATPDEVVAVLKDKALELKQSVINRGTEHAKRIRELNKAQDEIGAIDARISSLQTGSKNQRQAGALELKRTREQYRQRRFTLEQDYDERKAMLQQLQQDTKRKRIILALIGAGSTGVGAAAVTRIYRTFRTAGALKSIMTDTTIP